MKKSTKIWLGVLTFLPFLLTLVYMIYFFSFFFKNIIELEHNQEGFPIEFFQSFSVMFLIIMLAIIIKLIVMIYYIIHVSNNPKNENNTKIMWIVLLTLVGTITSIIYYFVEILPIKETENRLGYNN